MGLILSRPSQHDEPSTSYHITYKTRSGPARRKRRPSSPNSQGIHASRNVATSTTLDISKPTPKPVAEQGEHLTSTQTKGEEIVAPVRPFSHQPTPPPRPSSFYRGQGRLSSFFMRCIGHQNHHPLLPPSTTAFEDEQAREAWAYQQSFLTELSRRDAQQRVRSARFFLGICILLVLVWVWIGNWFLVDKRRIQRKQRRPRKHDQAIQAALIDLVIPPGKTDKVVQVGQPKPSPRVDVGTSMEQVPPRPSSPALPPVPPNTPTRILSFFPPRRLLLPARSQDEIRARETRSNDFLAFFYVWLNIRRDWLRLRAGRVRRQERRDAAVGPDTGTVNAGSNELAAATGEEENTRSGEANPIDAWVRGEIKGMRTISRCTSERHRVVWQVRQKDGCGKKSDAQTQCGGERGDANDAVASYSKGKGKSKDRRMHFTDGVCVPTTSARTTTRPSSSFMPRAPSLQATSSQACSHSQPQHRRGASLSLNSKDPLHLWEAGVAQDRHAKTVNPQKLAEQQKHSIEPKVGCKGTQLLSIFETRQEEWRALVMDIEGMAEKMFEEQLGVKTSTPKEPQAEVFPGSLMGLECNSFDFDFPCLASTDTDDALGFGGGSVLVKHVHPAHTVQRNESMNTLRVRNMMERNRNRGDPWATWDWR